MTFEGVIERAWHVRSSAEVREARLLRDRTASIGTPDGRHLWCARHRLVVVFPCGWRHHQIDQLLVSLWLASHGRTRTRELWLAP